MTKMIIGLLMTAILVINGCTSTNVEQKKPSNLVGNQALLHEVLTLEDLSLDNKTTVEMLESLGEKIKGDAFAEDLVDEATWLVRFNEFEHSQHSLAFLAAYIKDGTQIVCPGHELQHIQLFVRHNNFDLMNETIEGLEESYPKWKADAYAKRAKFPNFYKNLDNTTRIIEETLPRIKAGNYSIENEAQFLAANDVC